MIDRIDHIVPNCRNIEATASWYERALGFRQETYSSPAAPGQRIALKFGQHKFNLSQTGDGMPAGGPARSMRRARSICAS